MMLTELYFGKMIYSWKKWENRKIWFGNTQHIPMSRWCRIMWEYHEASGDSQPQWIHSAIQFKLKKSNNPKQTNKQTNKTKQNITNISTYFPHNFSLFLTSLLSPSLSSSDFLLYLYGPSFLSLVFPSLLSSFLLCPFVLLSSSLPSLLIFHLILPVILSFNFTYLLPQIPPFLFYLILITLIYIKLFVSYLLPCCDTVVSVKLILTAVRKHTVV